MTDQTPNPNQPPNDFYSTWEGFESCAAEPEAVLAAFLENQKSRPRQFDNSKAEERRERIAAWYSFFTIHDDEIWENEELEKLEKQQGGQQGQGHELSDEDDEEQEEEDDSEDKEEGEDQRPMRMMQRQEIFADWKAGPNVPHHTYTTT